jgi:hypothetical protein
MTPADALKFVPILQAYGEGKVIQFRPKGATEWADPDYKEAEWSMTHSADCYRIKPEPRYVPWTFETCPVGTVIVKKSGDARGVIINSGPGGTYVFGAGFGYQKLFDECTLLDGTPCGVVEG